MYVVTIVVAVVIAVVAAAATAVVVVCGCVRVSVFWICFFSLAKFVCRCLWLCAGLCFLDLLCVFWVCFVSLQ